MKKTSDTSNLKKIFDMYMTEMGLLHLYTHDGLDFDVPIQVQLEVVPLKLVKQPIKGAVDCYRCDVKSIKARVKPGTTAFAMKEQKIKEAEKDPNRFTGLEIDSEEDL